MCVHKQHHVRFSKRFVGLEPSVAMVRYIRDNTATSVNKNIGYYKLRQYGFMKST